ncbi:MAG: hypothetical protein AVDCRST_MAG38-2798 [uncultured Solirubrobacteraceae bacterium]|uniref:Uncharacterized protein n=1 Tax=uncultured Solirubrobacteraceae bacterium TaxID=1162706 RepID=A0A6J4SJG0_9ACTN|nr:MAG: hypothetical protein AVDCRST_MAG38-2798 [uncultured Solirubrobacteraceae bacterium]
MTSAETRHRAAAHLLQHPELADRAQPYLAPGGIDWDGLWRGPPWSSREERVIRAAADVCGRTGGAGLEPVTVAELATRPLWDPGPYSRVAEDHSHRVLQALVIAIGLPPDAAQRWLTARYDSVARAMDVWDWGALPTDVDAPTHVLSSRPLAAKAEKHLYFGRLNRVFESLGAEEWTPDEQVLIDVALAFDDRGPGPTLDAVVTLLDEEQLAAVVEGLYIFAFA